MSEGNRDKLLKHMLSAYELGLLDDEQREEFELYLLEHDELFENVRQFERVSRLLRDRQNIREAINQMAAESDAGSRPRSRKGRVWRMLVPTSAAAIIILFALILKDWRFELEPSEEARAAGNVLAIPSFVNLANPDDPHQVGEVIANLLITDLSQSTYLRVISSQRIEGVKSWLGYEKGNTPDLAAAVRMAKAARATTILLGSVLQEDSVLAVSVQLVEIETGQVSGALRLVGAPHEDVFSLVDRLTPQIKGELGLPRGAQDEIDPLVADMTTHSPEAYRYYIDGVDYVERFDYNRAVMSFEHALEIDSTCAMAWYHLAMLKDGRLIDKAMQYSGNTARRDRYLIMTLKAGQDGEVREAIKVLEEAAREYPDDKDIRVRLGQYSYRIGDDRSAIGHYRAAIAADSACKLAYNGLAYSYGRLGMSDSALWASDEYIALAPREANPYDSKGDIAADAGRVTLAIEAYRQALSINPDFLVSLSKLGHMYLFAGEYHLADSCFRVLAAAPSAPTRAAARLYLAYAPLFQGDVRTGLERLDDGIAADNLEPATDQTSAKYLVKALILGELADTLQAIAAVQESVRLYQAIHQDDRVSYRYCEVEMLARFGRFHEAQAITGDIKTFLMERKESLYCYWYAAGAIELARGNGAVAVTLFEKADSLDSRYFTRYQLAQAYLAAGQYDSAISVFERLFTEFTQWRAQFVLWDFKARFQLGIAYEEVGRPGDAMRQYEYLLERWESAAPEIDWVKEAARRLERLRDQS
jgi:tetratricopeptide (TPR) repeat protein